MREILGVGMKIKPGKCWARNGKGLRGVLTLDGICFPHVAYACKSFRMQGVFRGREKSLEKGCISVATLLLAFFLRRAFLHHFIF